MTAALGLGEDLGLADLDARLRRDDADAGVAVGVHEAQRDDPVEPGVGDLVGDGCPALVAATRGGDGLLQRGDGLRLLDSLGRARRQHRGDARGDLADERGARPGRERLQRCGFHQREIRFPSFRVWTSALRRAARYLSTSSSVSRTPDAPGTGIVLTETVCFGGGGSSPAPCWRRGEQVEQRRVVARLEVRSDLEDERDLALAGDPRRASGRSRWTTRCCASGVALA